MLNDAVFSPSIKQCCKYTATQFNTDRSNQARASDARLYLLQILPIIFYQFHGLRLHVLLGIIIISGDNRYTFKGLRFY